MDLIRDYNGVIRAKKQGYSFLCVKVNTGRVLCGCPACFKHEVLQEDIAVMSIEEYMWYTSGVERSQKEPRNKTVMEWYEQTDFSKLLGICNLRC